VVHPSSVVIAAGPHTSEGLAGSRSAGLDGVSEKGSFRIAIWREFTPQ
jgi:hypothetical protein